MIKFLRDYATKAFPPEKFTAGQVVSDRSEASELHFVTRGAAAFVDEEGKLTDHEGKPVEAIATTEVVSVSANRDGTTGRAGEVALTDGTPQRGSPGPGKVMAREAAAAGEARKAAPRR